MDATSPSASLPRSAFRRSVLLALLPWALPAAAGDTLDLATNLLSIPAVTVGGTAYSNVVLRVDPQNVVSVGAVGGFPLAGLSQQLNLVPHTMTLSGTDNSVSPPVTYTISLSETPGKTTTFEGRTVMPKVTAITLKAGSKAVQSTETSYYATDGSKQWGSETSEGDYVIYSNHGTLPASAAIGEQGVLHAYITYADSSKAKVRKVSVERWVLEAGERSDTAYACNYTTKVGIGWDGQSTRFCFHVDSQGKLLGQVRATLDLGLAQPLEVSGQIR